MKKINNILAFALVVIFALPMLSSCGKKGEGDPGLSFKSRESRLMRAWKLTKIEGTEQYQDFNNNTVILTYSYDGTIYTMSGGGQSVSGTGTFEVEYLEYGNLTVNETFTANGNTDVYSATGTWQWLGSDGEQNYLLTDGGNNIFNGGLYYIYRLASKELILKQSYNQNDNGDVSKGDYTYTFEAK
ncbi:MAG: hypothetical protein PHT69_05955 [Bacteroidales bacterium]|nr:hypothetical protein [Bacteroidales bacterium]